MIIERNSPFQTFGKYPIITCDEAIEFFCKTIKILEDAETSDFEKIENLTVLLENQGISIKCHDF